jgi:hypothetical protein
VKCTLHSVHQLHCRPSNDSGREIANWATVFGGVEESVVALRAIAEVLNAVAVRVIKSQAEYGTVTFSLTLPVDLSPLEVRLAFAVVHDVGLVGGRPPDAIQGGASNLQEALRGNVDLDL